MNESTIHKQVAKQTIQTAHPKANAYVFLFLYAEQLLNTILASRTNGTFTKPHKSTPRQSFAKEPFSENPQAEMRKTGHVSYSQITRELKLNTTMYGSPN